MNPSLMEAASELSTDIRVEIRARMANASREYWRARRLAEFKAGRNRYVNKGDARFWLARAVAAIRLLQVVRNADPALVGMPPLRVRHILKRYR